MWMAQYTSENMILRDVILFQHKMANNSANWLMLRPKVNLMMTKNTTIDKIRNGVGFEWKITSTNLAYLELFRFFNVVALPKSFKSGETLLRAPIKSPLPDAQRNLIM